MRRCRSVLGDSPTAPRAPEGYRDSLALCAIDSIWSIGVRYTDVEGVLARYRAGFADADDHDLTDLLAAIEQAGGTDGWRSGVGTRHRTSTRGGIFKSEALKQAAQALVAVGIKSTVDVHNATDAQENRAEQACRSVRGQRSGISWHYLLLLAGVEEVNLTA